MEKVIVYQLEGAPVSITYPMECGLTLAEIGRKDVPSGLPFWIVDRDFIPADRTLRNAWQLDTESMGEPNGLGEQE